MESESQVALAFVGDVFPGEDDATVSPAVMEALRGAHTTIINLESPLTEGGSKLPGKSLHLRSPSKHVAILEALNTSVACLANNHMCDWGPVGVEDTRNILKEHRIRFTGAGNASHEASAPAIIGVGDLSVGIIAFGVEAIETHPVAEASFGCSILEIEEACERIRSLAATTDIVVVAAHWGYTNYHLPLPEDIRAARRMIDAGATIVFGHHPHVIQGYEEYGQGAIIYSLGNFLFGRFCRNGRVVNQSRENRNGLICIVRVARSGVQSLEFSHTEQSPDSVSVDLVNARRARKRNRLLRKLSKRLTAENYEKTFRRYVVRRLIYRALRWCNPKMWRNLNRAYFQGVRNAMRLLKTPNS